MIIKNTKGNKPALSISDRANPNELNRLVNRVIEQMASRDREDIEQWAERLANDLSRLTD